MIDNQSSYYLHPSHTLAATIIAIKFDGKNYKLWENAVTTALTAKNKIAFINDLITKPVIQKGVYSSKAKA